MRTYRVVLFPIAAIGIFVAIVFTLASVIAGNSRPKRPHSPVASSGSSSSNKVHILSAGLWRTDGNFVSTIRVKNILVVAPIEVSPILFMADGTAYPLAPVTIPVSGVATISINDALAVAPQAMASHISQFGSATVVYTCPSPGHVVAQVAAIDVPRSLSFVYPFDESVPMPGDDTVKVLQGLWWKRDAGVTGSISLSNSTDVQRTVTLRDASPSEGSNSEEIELAPHTTQVLDVQQFSREASREDSRAGGLCVEYKGPQGAILVTGSLANESEGYSANMPFWSHNVDLPTKKFTIGSAGIIVGKPDPTMMPGFAADTKFIPYLALRNATSKPLEVTLQLNYMPTTEGSNPVNQNLSLHRLGPFEARLVDLKSMLDAAGLKSFNGMINLSVSYTGHGGDLVLATGSVDETGTYVFEVATQGIGTSIGKISGYWNTANGNDAMFSLWNPTDAPQDIVATIYYGDGSGVYHLPIHLAPQASTMVDVAMLIMDAKPDLDGEVIPANIREGSASFASAAHGEAPGGEGKMTVVISGGVFNVSEGTCGSICNYCNGYSNWGIIPSPIVGPIQFTASASAYATDSYGNDQTLSGGSWSSDTPSVATVDNSGTVNGVAVGSANITDFLSNVIVFQGNYCVNENMNDNCPTANISPQGPASVVWVSLSLRNTYGESPSSDDSASREYVIALGSLNTLGTFFSTGAGANHLWRTGVEIVGTVSPSDFAGTIVIQRQVDGTCTYSTATLLSCRGPFPDTSDPAFRDDDPQSGGSAGKVYDLDAPGIGTTANDPANTILRVRTNFRQWATLNGVPVSYDFLWYSRVSVIKSDSGDNLSPDISGDNTSGTGTTNLSWNLQ